MLSSLEQYDPAGEREPAIFDDPVRIGLLPNDVLAELDAAIRDNTPLNPSSASMIAVALRDWAESKGAAHFSYWFHPLSGPAAEKRFALTELEGFTLSGYPAGLDASKGENPRDVFEGHGYIAWDVSSPPLVRYRDGGAVLYIPTTLQSPTGSAKDEKIPLLRSMAAVNRQMLRLLAALGNKSISRVVPVMGVEQEFYLLTKKAFESRPDLKQMGRALFGSTPANSRGPLEFYSPAIPEQEGEFLRQVELRLQRLGVRVQVFHNEMAPGQFELACAPAQTNVAADWNRLVMSVLTETAPSLGFVCLLHEKPFSGFNGSGKHLNWFLVADDGTNLLDPIAAERLDKRIFPLLAAVMVRALDRHSMLLRASTAVPGNDLRFSTNELPIFVSGLHLGRWLHERLDDFARGNVGPPTSETKVMPLSLRDAGYECPFRFSTDRIEFRLPGASQSPAWPATVLNTVIADAIEEVSDFLEKSADQEAAARMIVGHILQENGAIIFDRRMQSPSETWAGPEFLFKPDGIGTILAVGEKKYAAPFTRQGVLNPPEYAVRVEINLERQVRRIISEAQVMRQIAYRYLIPAAIRHLEVLGNTTTMVKNAGSNSGVIASNVRDLSTLTEKLDLALQKLLEDLEVLRRSHDLREEARTIKSVLLPSMDALRRAADDLEAATPADLWPLPSSADLLFRI